MQTDAEMDGNAVDSQKGSAIEIENMDRSMSNIEATNTAPIDVVLESRAAECGPDVTRLGRLLRSTKEQVQPRASELHGGFKEMFAVRIFTGYNRIDIAREV